MVTFNVPYFVIGVFVIVDGNLAINNVHSRFLYHNDDYWFVYESIRAWLIPDTT